MAGPARDFVRAAISPICPICRIARREFPAQQPEKQFRPHRDQPGRMIAAVRHHPRFFMASGGTPPAVAFGLDAGIGEIQILNALNLEVQPRQRIADYIR